MVAPLEAPDWRKARPIRRPRASRFALFGCFWVLEVLLFALFQEKRFLDHDLWHRRQSQNCRRRPERAKPFAAVAQCSAKKEPGNPGKDLGSVIHVKIQTERRRAMGRVSAFLGMVLYMYPERNGRHNRPHVHVMYGDDECVLSVPEGEVLAGEIPGKQLRNAQTFIDLRNDELMLNWKLCMEGKDVVWIDPIR